MRCKSDVLPLLLAFHEYVQTQFRLPIVALQTDNGREFDNAALRSFFSHHGISLRLSCPYTSQQNGKAERILRTLNNSVRSLLFQSSMPPVYWAEALATATYLLNRRPCTATKPLTPHELLLDIPPDYHHLRVFGCLCYPNQSAVAPHKLSPRSMSCVFLGYSLDHKGYRCLSLGSQRIITSRHVIFDEATFRFHSLTKSNPCTCPTNDGSMEFSDPHLFIVPLPRSPSPWMCPTYNTSSISSVKQQASVQIHRNQNSSP
jgi:hypothetical protein